MFPTKQYTLLCIFIACSYTLLGQNNKNFRHLSPRLDNGVVTVSNTIQDPIGNIWMVCGNGILVYDGYYYTLIKKSTIFPKIKYNDNIEDIITDADKNVWIISYFGLITKYNAINGQFEDITSLLKPDDNIVAIVAQKKSLWMASKNGNVYLYHNATIDSITTIPNMGSSVDNINDIVIGKTKELYVSTKEGKLFNYSLKASKLTEINGSFSNYPGGLVLATDNYNRLWIGTETQGLFIYDIASKQFIQNSFFKKKRYNINKEMFITLFHDSDGFIWGGTDGGGLYKINSLNGKIELFTRQDGTNEFSLSSNTILNLSEDKHKNLWISTNYGNLNVLPSSNTTISYHSGSKKGTPLRILSVYKSTTGVLWAGTDGTGLTKIIQNPDGSTITTQYFNNLFLNKGFYVQSITEDDQTNIWFGTYKNGLWHYNSKTDKFKKIEIYNSKQQKATDVRTVFSDSKERIWISSNVGIAVYASNLKLLATFDNNSNGINGSIGESILEDENGVIWLGQYNGGLFNLNENSNDLSKSTFTNHLYNNQKNKSEFHSVKSMSLGGPNELWLINHYGKLLKFNTKTNTYNNLDHIKAIKGQTFVAIIKEDSNHLWISSFNGISHLDIKNSTLKTYDTTDGLQDNTFLSRSAFKDRYGTLYFGGIMGLNYFNPKYLTKKESLATLHINSIEILNQPADSLIPTQIKTGIFNVASLRLKYNQSSFSFRFSAIDNILNPKYYYAYRLKGFDEGWITNHSERIATYTNIPSGDYTFEVKAGTKKGLWDIPAKKIAIRIAQPLWNTTTAYILYLACLALLVYGLQRWYGLRKKLLIEKINHKKENELNELKMHFFAKMSHEIQTPVTLILGPIENMLKRSDQNGNLLLKQRLNIILNNTKRLSRIARELTLIRNKELNRLRLTVTKNNLCKHIAEISLSFMELARKKQIDFVVNCPKNLSETWYDKEKLEHVIYNLLSNAFKFTPKEGNIQLSVAPINSKKLLKLTVTDSGPGIPKEELDTIFELFYQSKEGKKNIGSGIGLALIKDITDLHRGTIKVNSTPFEGTIFTVTLPITEDAYAESERIQSNDPEEVLPRTIEKEESLTENETINLSKKTILIVEDNYDLQTFLQDLLCRHYNILMADNGEEGYHYAKNNFPDLILSDIMMPKLDGIAMCKKLQKDKLTKHIPVILMTAKNSTHSKISGLESGAIEYINKPFNTNELLLKIKNIILSKEHIISKYRKEIISRPEVTLEKSQDEIFLENLVLHINSRLEDANFKIEELAESLNMGYSSLYRKCQSLTGHSLVDFVRLHRLKKAAILISKYGYNISEASYMTGFNDPKYFSKCFKKHFKITPGNFKKEAQEMGTNAYLKKHRLDRL
ncbi:MAG: ATP-binding protein [Cellulophaga sp.]